MKVIESNGQLCAWFSRAYVVPARRGEVASRFVYAGYFVPVTPSNAFHLVLLNRTVVD